MPQPVTAVHHSEANGVHFEHTHFGSDVEVRGSDGSYCGWNLTHYLAVKAARAELPDARSRGSHSVPHEAVGKELVDVTTGLTYTVEKVITNWWRGRFLVGMLVRDGSHRQCVLENQSCLDPAIQAQAKEFGLVFRFKGH